MNFVELLKDKVDENGYAIIKDDYNDDFQILYNRIDFPEKLKTLEIICGLHIRWHSELPKDGTPSEDFTYIPFHKKYGSISINNKNIDKLIDELLKFKNLKTLIIRNLYVDKADYKKLSILYRFYENYLLKCKLENLFLYEIEFKYESSAYEWRFFEIFEKMSKNCKLKKILVENILVRAWDWREVIRNFPPTLQIRKKFKKNILLKKFYVEKPDGHRRELEFLDYECKSDYY